MESRTNVVSRIRIERLEKKRVELTKRSNLFSSITLNHSVADHG